VPGGKLHDRLAVGLRERLDADDPLKLEDSSLELLDPIEQVIDDTLRKDTTSSTGSGSTGTRTSGS